MKDLLTSDESSELCCTCSHSHTHTHTQTRTLPRYPRHAATGGTADEHNVNIASLESQIKNLCSMSSCQKFRNKAQETAQPSICAGYAFGGRI